MFVCSKSEHQDNQSKLAPFLQEYQQFLFFTNIPTYLTLLLQQDTLFLHFALKIFPIVLGSYCHLLLWLDNYRDLNGLRLWIQHFGSLGDTLRQSLGHLNQNKSTNNDNYSQIMQITNSFHSTSWLQQSRSFSFSDNKTNKLLQQFNLCRNIFNVNM